MKKTTMKKTAYETPSVKTFEITFTQLLATSVNNVDGGDSGIGYGGGGSGPARVKEQDDYDIWDNDWSVFDTNN